MEMKRKFKEFFKKKGYTQKEIAEKIGYRQDMVGKFLVKPNFYFLKDIIKLFPDIDLNYILKDDLEVNGLFEDHGASYGKEKHEVLLDDLEETIHKLRDHLSQK